MADIEKTGGIIGDVNLDFVREAADIGLKVAEPLERQNKVMAESMAEQEKVHAETIDKMSKKHALTVILTNAFWAVIVALFIWFAWMSPAEVEQSQDFPNQTQEQTVKGVS